MTDYTLEYIANHIGATLVGDANKKITALAPLPTAQNDQISFLSDKKFKTHLSSTKAGAVILTQSDAELCNSDKLIMSIPYLGFAKVAQLFHPLPYKKPGIHLSCVMGNGCEIDESVSIGANCVIGDHVKIGANTTIYPNTTIDDNCVIGKDCLFYSNLTLYHDVTIGDRVILHSGTVIGSDGFGFAPDEIQHYHKIPQIGNVVIEDDVEIGANTTIDRGALDDTIIKTGAKIDNQVQIAHNVKIGAHTAIAGCTGIAGSTTIGKHCMIGGAAAITGHINICDRAVIGGSSNISKDITTPQIYSSSIPAKPYIKWQRNLVHFNQMDQLVKRVKQLEKTHDEH